MPVLQCATFSRSTPARRPCTANLSVQAHGIIGENGAEKSTPVDVIASITEPTEGEIIVVG